MKALKILVIAMSLLMVAGLGLLGWGLATKTMKHGSTPPASASAADSVPTFDPVSVPLPVGARVAQMSIASDRIILHVVGRDGDRIVVLDPLGGHIVGSFVLAPAPR